MRKYWTDTTITTDSEGYAVVDAFKGDYTISADGKITDITITDDTPATLCLK